MECNGRVYQGKKVMDEFVYMFKSSIPNCHYWDGEKALCGKHGQDALSSIDIMVTCKDCLNLMGNLKNGGDDAEV